jgi:hypothetical protein
MVCSLQTAIKKTGAKIANTHYKKISIFTKKNNSVNL